MARYTINYLTGHEETVTADGVEYDTEASDYTFTGPDGRGVVAIVPAGNVLSIVLTEEPEAVTG
ncbi:hypothetical protein [Streptomyces fungicidicus]|uniref:hypothetical protein n=1 Tax=Streptomyces fungicidicus TaxID=68203 RepID=UPI00381A6A3E